MCAPVKYSLCDIEPASNKLLFGRSTVQATATVFTVSIYFDGDKLKSWLTLNSIEGYY